MRRGEGEFEFWVHSPLHPERGLVSIPLPPTYDDSDVDDDLDEYDKPDDVDDDLDKGNDPDEYDEPDEAVDDNPNMHDEPYEANDPDVSNGPYENDYPDESDEDADLYEDLFYHVHGWFIKRDGVCRLLYLIVMFNFEGKASARVYTFQDGS
ncbi:hypothetical protein E2562_010322 [Oryza meyeriana var. granulata]|uniref:Uncharacterized protein n=1 Tax=Oryza meyeriana var. granulata TaxID=110450 RepID=A0A6G1F667_9ORYZ|nr:hypothetical protein E2562_010322 [Oryza meyeriana var. granulata]